MHYYQILLLILLSISSILAYEITRGVGEPLYEPPRIDLTSNGARLTLYVRLCKYSVTDNGFLYLRMTRFCYCTDESNDESCSYPGPTLMTKGNTRIIVKVVNQLSGEESTMDDTYWNHFKDMDTTNLHTHGIHVSPFEDDVLIAIEPDQEYTLSYNYGFHYPGTFWYHAHHHGSTLFQVDGGLHGAQIMTSDDIYEEELSKYEENILLFNWQYPIPKSECIPDANRGGSVSKLCPGRSSINNDPRQQLLDSSRTVDVLVSSMCDVYCQMPQFQLDSSDFVYDLQTDLNPIRISGVNKYEILYFTNGQLRPVINDLEVGIFRRLRLINSMGQFYIQFKFPDEEDECSVYLIAVDGIYIDNEYKNFDLSSSSHRNELLVSPGSRADVLIKCNEEGTYHIYASENNRQDTQQLPKLNRVSNGYKLFSIKVNEKNENKKHNINGLIMNSLPSQYPNKPVGTYIEDLYDYGETNTECPCHRPFGSFVSNPQQCIFEFEEDPDTVNGKPFDIRNSNPPLHIADSLSIIDYDEAYEFNINNDDGHVYHQHINPFQYTQHVGQNGFIAFKNVWADTFGNYGVVQQVKVRTWTRDYWGLIILHCHILEHEDEGMMGHYNILKNSQRMNVCPYINDKFIYDSASEITDETDNNNNNSNIMNVLSNNLNVTIPMSIVVFISICGLIVLIGFVYKKYQKQKGFIKTNANDNIIIDESISNDNDNGEMEIVETTNF